MQHIDNTRDTKTGDLPAKRKSRPVSHGIKFWLRTGKINPSIRGYRKLQRFLEDLEHQLIEEQGGAEKLTAAREMLIRSTIRAYGVILLTEMYIAKYSVIRPDKARRGVLQYQPILERSYWGAQSSIRQNLMALGLDNRAPAEPSLADVMREIDAERAQAAGQGKPGGGRGDRLT
jgi:hypothetical protein